LISGVMSACYFSVEFCFDPLENRLKASTWLRTVGLIFIGED